MKTFTRLFLLLLLIQFSCDQKEVVDIDAEIKTIENGLTKGIQVKGTPVETFSIEERMEVFNVPGLSIAVVRDGKLHWAKGYGYANTNDSTLVNTKTLFQAGSISKPIAALAALKLMEENKVDLDTDVNTYLTDWKIEENEFTETEKVTLRRLLTHTAGMTVHGFPGYKPTDSFPSITQVLNGEGNTPRIFVDTKPDSIWRYSGGGYTVMEKVIEDVTSEPLEAYMQTRILMPLQMDRSTYAQPLPEENQENVSLAYNTQGEIIEGEWSNYPEQAAAGLWTTPSDLAKYYIEVFDILNGKADGILSKNTIDMMLTKHKNDWGLGPSLNGENESFKFGHGGKNEGFSNNMTGYVNSADAVIVMTSADLGMGLVSEIFRSVSEYYNWDLNKARIVELAEPGTYDLDKIVGTFLFEGDVPGIGKYYVQISKNGEQLVVSDPNNGETDTLRALDAENFIDLEDGDSLSFSFENNSVSFVWNNSYKFNKVDASTLENESNN